MVMMRINGEDMALNTIGRQNMADAFMGAFVHEAQVGTQICRRVSSELVYYVFFIVVRLVTETRWQMAIDLVYNGRSGG